MYNVKHRKTTTKPKPNERIKKKCILQKLNLNVNFFCMVLKSYENKKEEILEYILKETVKPSGIFKVDIFAINEKHKGKIVSTLLFLHPKSKLYEHDA